MTTPAVAPYVPFYANSAPYITVDEFLQWPTGVTVNQLVPGGTEEQQRAALASVIRSASSHADTICRKVLAATVDIASGEYRIRDGKLHVTVDYTPLVAVLSVRLGYRPDGLQPLTDLSGLWVDRKSITIPVGGYTIAGTTRTNPAATASNGHLYAVVEYVNGWPNTLLAVDVAAGATSIEVVDATGIFAGMPLRIFDLPSGMDSLTVAADYTPGSTTVPLAAPISGAHAAGSSCSALPPAIKEAVIWLTAGLIKTRGADALVIDSISQEPGKTQKGSDPGGSAELGIALGLLTPHRRSA